MRERYRRQVALATSSLFRQPIANQFQKQKTLTLIGIIVLSQFFGSVVTPRQSLELSWMDEWHSKRSIPKSKLPSARAFRFRFGQPQVKNVLVIMQQS